MTLRLNGSTSGYVEIDAPAVAGSTSITIPATTGGEFVVTDSNGNVGLGTTSPAEELHINSATPSIRLSDTAGSNLITRITNSQGDLYFDADFGGTTGDIIFRSNGTLGRWVAGGGLAFGTDTAAVNQLDDYEEGTWTPAIAITGGTGGSISYNIQSGRYVKIGSFVHVQCHLNINTSTLTGGAAELAGLPFNFPSGNGARGGLTIHYSAGFFTGLTGYQITIRGEDNVARGRFNYADAADLQVSSDVGAANLTSGGIMVTGMYRVS